MVPQYQAKAAAELTWYKLDFQTDQDLRLRVGCEIGKKVHASFTFIN